jgi:hypothetical protein
MATLFAASIGAGPLLAAEDAQVPKRKPGLWEIVTVASVTGMTKIKVCVGEDDDLVTLSQGDCSKPEVTLLNEGLIVDLVCTSEQGTQSISTAFTRRFQHALSRQAEDEFRPAGRGHSAYGREARWEMSRPRLPP